MGFLDRGIEIKTPEQIDAMRRAGLVVGETLELLRPRSAPASRPASSTRSRRTTSAPRGRPLVQGLPRVPGVDLRLGQRRGRARHPRCRALGDGDVISIDCGAIVDGWHGDAAITVPVGVVPAEVTELMRVTEEAMWRGIAAARLGGRVTDISHAVEGHVRGAGQLRHPRGLRRPRHRVRDAPAAQRAQLRPARPRAEARAGPRAGRRADDHARRQGDRSSSRTTGR